MDPSFIGPSFDSSASLPNAAPNFYGVSPTQIRPTVETLLTKVLNLIELKPVRQDSEIFSALERKYEWLITLNSAEFLSLQEQDFYNRLCTLLDESGKVRSFVKQKLFQPSREEGLSYQSVRLDTTLEEEELQNSNTKPPQPEAPSQAARNYFEQGKKLVAKRSYDEAMTAFSEALLLYPAYEEAKSSIQAIMKRPREPISYF